MEEDRKLYPLRLSSVCDEYSWGREEFLLADLGYRDSVLKDGWLAGNTLGEVMDMFMDRVVGDNVFEYYGRQFPFQIKRLVVNGKMPLRVHPDDRTAAQRYDFLGKEKLWCVTRAGRGARLHIGFRENTDASALYSSCSDADADELMDSLVPRPGECFHIPSGVPHYAEGDMTIVEVSESSPLDFCLCDWNAEKSAEFDPSLGLVDALDFISYVPAGDCRRGEAGKQGGLVRIPQFSVSRLIPGAGMKVVRNDDDACYAYTCLSGEAELICRLEGVGDVPCQVKEGGAVIVPSEIREYELVSVRPGTALLEVTVDRRADADPYIDSSVAATLPDSGDNDN